MSAALNQMGSQLFGLLGKLSVELAVLAVVVLLAGRFLRIKSPAVRHLLWLAVLLKPIIAITISSPWTVFRPLTSSLEPGWLALGYAPWALRVRESFAVVADHSTVDVATWQLTLAGWVATLWVLGSVLLMCRIVIGYGVTWRLRRQARVHRAGPLFGALQEARLTLDINAGVDVATSGSIRSPIVLGILRPLIVVPTDLMDRLCPDGLAMVLMHELAHVRRYDNLTLLVQRVIGVALFFHPAVWLCGRMLQREAEQASDDLVMCATGRSEDYARGLTGVAELAHVKTHLRRRIPMMNVFAAAESDLALRIRRAVAGGVRRMGTRSRLVAALLICGACAVTLPATGLADSDDGIDWEAVKATAPEDWSEELRTQLVAAGHDLERLAERVRKGQEGAVWREAMPTDPDEWSEELKARILALKPGSSLEEIAEGIRQRQVWQAAMTTAQEDWSEDLKAKLLELKPGSTLEEIAEGILKRQQAARTRGRSIKRLEDLGRRIRAAVQAGEMTPEEGREKMATARRRLEAASGIEAIGRKIRAAVAAGDLTPEEGREKMAAARRGLQAKRKRTSSLEDIGRRIRAAVEAGDLTPEEGRKKYEPLRQKAAATRAEDVKDDGVDWRTAMAAPPDEWSDELKAQIVAAGYDLEAVAERIRRRQQAAGIRDGGGEGYVLKLSAPNPFNPQTTIRYAIPEAGDVQIVIYNLTGQKVRTLLARQMEAGSHQLVWDGLNEVGQQVASGTYLVEMKAGNFSQTMKVTLAR